MNEDFADLLRLLLKEGARFLVVGAHAMAAHGVPRATGDIDVWIEADPTNAQKVFRALAAFGAPLGAMGVGVTDLTEIDRVIQIGLPPRRIDVLTGITALEFDQAWERRENVEVAGLSVPVLSRADLLTNKRSAGRPRDLADVAILEAEGDPTRER